MPSEPATDHRRRVLVTVGTDHHPFDRLVHWMDAWLAEQQEPAAECFVQWGSATVAPACPGTPFLPADELTARLDEAEVIVCHGGPGSISAAWERGLLPIVVPRLAALGEVVDDHQVDFCDQIAAAGKIALAGTAEDFALLLTKAVSDPANFSIRLDSTAGAAVARAGALIEELVARPRRRGVLSLFRRRKGQDSLAVRTGTAAQTPSAQMPPAQMPPAQTPPAQTPPAQTPSAAATRGS